MCFFVLYKCLERGAYFHLPHTFHFYPLKFSHSYLIWKRLALTGLIFTKISENRAGEELSHHLVFCYLLTAEAFQVMYKHSPVYTPCFAERGYGINSSGMQYKPFHIDFNWFKLIILASIFHWKGGIYYFSSSPVNKSLNICHQMPAIPLQIQNIVSHES